MTQKREESNAKCAVLTSAVAPDEQQRARFERFLLEKYGEGWTLVWQKDLKIGNGFRLTVGPQVYDWSAAGRLRQFKAAMRQLRAQDGDVIPLIKETVDNWTPQALAEEIGTVLTCGDGIAAVSGLEHAAYGEILLFEDGVRGMVLDLRETSVGCILFDSDAEIRAGSAVRRTGKTAGVPVGEALVGRVVNALGVPIDGRGRLRLRDRRPIEAPAPGILERQPVHRPLETGILAIDSMFPIGRGQRELIIGDRQTGKTSLALDTILNQKGKDVLCIYVAIGQKISSVVHVTERLRQFGAMEHTIVVSATASEADPMQYIAPYTGCAIGEYFMEQGRDVLIVYDDLSKHAVAYRSLSLLLGRSPGREAYPGDVFYLHSRLLERAAALSDEKGGGTMTALPIVETQAGDVSAYIPTNIISITDGQIFLESDLFFAGQRPAVNIGLSVSRVGGDAQTKAMKRAVGTLRLDLAQYREMEVFTQFAGDLDDATRQQLRYGQGLMRMLRQELYHPYAQWAQVVILVAALSRRLTGLAPEEIAPYLARMLAHFEKEHAGLCTRIESTGQLTDADRRLITEIVQTIPLKEE